jgi:hypothetical protein
LPGSPPGSGFIELFLVHIVPPAHLLQRILCRRKTTQKELSLTTQFFTIPL